MSGREFRQSHDYAPREDRRTLERSVSLFAGDPVEREVLRRYVSNRGANVRDFAELRDALESVTDGDILVLRLTATSGAVPVEMTRQKGIRLPVLALADNAEVSIAAYRHGADIVAQLPMDMDLLCCTIDVLAGRAERPSTDGAGPAALDVA